MAHTTNRLTALIILSCLSFSYTPVVKSAVTEEKIGQLVDVMIKHYTEKPAAAPLTLQDVLQQIKDHPYMYSSLFIAALMVYRLESKGPCEKVDYDFNALMRGNDSYTAKLKRAVAWFDRYIIGQPYKSKSVKAKDGDLVISDPQEALGLMGIAQSNLKPALAGIGAAYFLNNPSKGCLSKDKLDGMGWAVLALIMGLK